MIAGETGGIRVAFTELIDLAAEEVGGKALQASDEFFAGKENLLRPGRGVFLPEKFTPRGKWMDGWESRRKRVPGHDWCVVKLGLPGSVAGLDIDTNYFTGNYPEFASVEGREGTGPWHELVAKARLKGGTRNLFPSGYAGRITHLRLNIFPDGGVARLRAHGVVLPDWKALLRSKAPLDLAAAANGGTVCAASDSYFGLKDNLLYPGRARNMGGGWETRRKRVPGHDWIVVALGRAGKLRRVEVDTDHYKGNFPESCSIDGVRLPGPAAADAFDLGCDVQRAKGPGLAWTEVLPRTRLKAHTRHRFDRQLRNAAKAYSHLRLNIFPDGGVSRLRVFADPA
ncbi:MAG: allantoicase [Elusimicrobia bacterium]|nr:allantoicase [Elusimicrobiota bacterium]